MKGAAINDCQPICKPIAWLVLPCGCMASIMVESAFR